MLELYLKALTRNDRVLVYVMFILGVFFVTYYFLVPPLSSRLATVKIENKKVSLEESVLKIKTQQETVDKRTQVLKSSIKVLDKALADMRDVQKYVDVNNAGIFEAHEKKRWIQYFDKIIHIAKENHLVLDGIEKKVLENKRYLLAVKFSGKYQNLLLFLHMIENKEHFLLVNSLKLFDNHMELEISILGH